VFQYRIISHVDHVNSVWEYLIFNAFQPAAQDNRLEAATEGVGQRPAFCEQLEAYFSRTALIKFAKNK
jgi:hypothetical protein